ncbi:hypothetical protein HYALB_00009818 [Hymenoscyphus albidus]|uniref:Uncharacterized protein n=1 Tax=Hymenoscyphus albidus TaxID=595503 RepID=A0A9N9QAK9_9HELO|nr:hypothetical protein HYALB_00009818 [Hymenoscyphus albidus]
MGKLRSRAAKLMLVAIFVFRLPTPNEIWEWHGNITYRDDERKVTQLGLHRARPASLELAVFALVDVVKWTGVTHLANPLHHGGIRLEHDEGVNAISWNGHGIGWRGSYFEGIAERGGLRVFVGGTWKWLAIFQICERRRRDANQYIPRDSSIAERLKYGVS